MNPHTLRYRNLNSEGELSEAAMRRERPEPPEQDDRTCLDGGRSARERDSRDTPIERDTASARDARERVKLVRAALRFLEKGRVDRARIVLTDLLDLLGQK